MIGTLKIKVHAASPNIPLTPCYAVAGSPSSIRVVDVPRAIGAWAITAVRVIVNYPDNTIVTANCVQTAGVWVGTIAGCAASGSVSGSGVVVAADGTDENGNAVTGYILGKGDLYVISADGTVVYDGTRYNVHLCDSQPGTPHKGDLYDADGVWKLYNGTAWVDFAAMVDSVNGKTGAVTLTGSDIAVSGEDATTVDAALAAKYEKPASGIPASDLADGVIPAIGTSLTSATATAVTGATIWSHIWGTLTALPTGFISLYDWCVSQLNGKVSKSGDRMTGALITTALTVGVRRYGTSSGGYSVAEGTQNEASSTNTHAEGDHTKAQNESEHAQGRYNKSTKVNTTFGTAGNTLHSVGFGTSSNPKNAHEITQDGANFVFGVGGYDGTNAVVGTNDLATVIGGKANASDLATEFSTASTYAVDDLCVYEGRLYKCTVAVTTAGAWTGSTNWESTDIAANIPTVPTNVSAFNNDAGYIKIPATRYAIIALSSTNLTNAAYNTDIAAAITTAKTYTLPAPVFDASNNRQVRDLILYADVGTNGSVTFSASDASGNALTFVSDDFSELASEDGLNAWLLSEMAANTFLVKRLALTTGTL